MPGSYELTKLDPASFEHLANLLAIRVLGAGHTGFGPGADGGRDGFFEGEAPYPSTTDRWRGTWYLQAKFHSPHLSTDPQKWLLKQIETELEAFQSPESRRKWPDNWIVATNIDPSGAPTTGAFDKARALVAAARPALAQRFHIWGGRKLLDLLILHPEIASFYSHFLSPGQIFTALYEHLKDERLELETILRYLIVRQFGEQQFTRLEQAGSDADTRPGIHRLYIDLPFRAGAYNVSGMVTEFLVRAAATCHRFDVARPDSPEWIFWHRHPARARVWFMRGGPGQGKSTVGQYLCQVQRAALLLQEDCFAVAQSTRALAEEIRATAVVEGYWPIVPRIPLSIELREYAQWFGEQPKHASKGILTYLSVRLSAGVEQRVLVGTLRRILGSRSWLIVFDGLDEVPHDVKDTVAAEVVYFLNSIVPETNADALALCTSRPQGYSGQFGDLEGPTVDLVALAPEHALKCARPVLALGRSEGEADAYFQILKSAMESGSVRELMTSPLQSHIMAVVVRDGGKPPERRWQLYNNFYQVIKRREANRDLPDRRLAKLLREDSQLLKTVHNRLGFLLHASAETSKGAQTRLDRNEFRALLSKAVSQMIEEDIEATIGVLMDATTNRLVLVNTPDDGDHLRFDIRPLQEFFAAEFIYESVNADEIRKRVEVIAGDAHWREVMHFLLSALVENGRLTELAVEVLENLNDSAPDTFERLLKRRIARGAVLTARLLAEGVLEQDKRVRSQFRHALEPIASVLEPSVLQPASRVRAPNSAAWFTSFLIDTVREADESESIGAAILLAKVLQDGHPKAREVQHSILECHPRYLANVLVATVDFRRAFRSHSHSNDIPRWVAQVAFLALRRSDWQLLGTDGVEAARGVLLSVGREVSSVVEAVGATRAEIHLLQIFLASETEIEVGSSPRDFGVLAGGGYFAIDWTNKKFSAPKWMGQLSPEELDRVAGVFGLVLRVVRFGTERSQPALREVVDYLNNSERGLENLPRSLSNLLPDTEFTDRRFGLRALLAVSHVEFEALLDEAFRSGERLRPSSGFTLGSNCTIDQWREVVHDHLALALHLWSDVFWEQMVRPRPPLLDQREAISILVGKVLEFPEVLVRYAGLWGRLVTLAPENEEELRKAFAGVSGRPVTSNRIFGADPLRLRLPEEACLLPHLTGALVFLRDVDDGPPSGAAEIYSSHVGEMATAASLAAIAQDRKYSNPIRFAASVLHILHPSGSDTMGTYQDLIVESCNNAGTVWVFNAVSVCLVVRGSEGDSVSRALAGRVLDTVRTDYVARRVLQTVLARWRETSDAPLSRSRLADKWLSGV